MLQRVQGTDVSFKSTVSIVDATRRFEKCLTKGELGALSAGLEKLKNNGVEDFVQITSVPTGHIKGIDIELTVIGHNKEGKERVVSYIISRMYHNLFDGHIETAYKGAVSRLKLSKKAPLDKYRYA